MQIVFTLCSNNYLASALVLGDTLFRHHPQTRFVIGLVDRVDAAVSYECDPRCTILPVEEIGIPDWESMSLRYNVIELNTAVKSFYFQYLFRQFPQIQQVVYLDPDIAIYAPLTEIEQSLQHFEIVLSPHVLSPLPLDALYPDENIFLNHGLYNLGFLGLRRGADSEAMLQWWSERMIERCRIDLAQGYFVDQLWMNLVPLYFHSHTISRHPGVNVAFWNLHERSIARSQEGYHVNGQPLLFFHFSRYSPTRPELVASDQSRITFASHPQLQSLFDEYREVLLSKGYQRLRQLDCYFVRRRESHLAEQRRAYIHSSLPRMCFHYVKKLQPAFIKRWARTLLSAP